MRTNVRCSLAELQRAPRALAVLVALALCAPHSMGCAGCRGGAEAPSAQAPPHSRSAAEITTSLASALPSDTHAVVMVRSWRSALERYEDARPQLEAITGDVGFVETDLRNTLGVDLRSPATLGDAGIALDGGVAFASHGEARFTVLLTEDSAALDARMREILPEQPFALQAEPEVRTLEDATLTLFRRRAGDDPLVGLAILGEHAALFREMSADQMESLTRSLAAAKSGANLAETELFRRAARDAGDHDLLCWASGPSLAEAGEVSDALADLVDGLDAELINSALTGLGESAAYLTMDSGGIRGDFTLRPSAEAFEESAALVGESGVPDFAGLVDASSFVVMRATVSPTKLADLMSTWRGRHQADLDVEALDELDTLIGMSLEDELAPALGSNLLGLMTRQRLMTLSRAMNSGAPGEWFSGLGAVVALDVRDRDVVQRALESLVANLDGRAATFSSNGTFVLEFTDAQADIGNLVLTDSALLLVPARQRTELVERVTEGGPSEGSGVALELAQGTLANGVYVDMQQIVSGPLGRVGFARLPTEVQRAFGRTSQISFTLRAEDAGYTGRLVVDFAPLAPATAD